MAIVTVRDPDRVLTEAEEIRSFLSEHGIWYRRFDRLDRVGGDASDSEILAAFDEPIRELKAEGGYVTADVIDVKPDTPGLDAMLDKFSKEHWHSEDEVRFIVAGRGIFHIHPARKPAFRIEVVAGDMINVPRRTLHWFHLCDERRIRAIRLFQDAAGWVPQYTGSGEESRHEPLCLGPIDIPPAGT